MLTYRQRKLRCPSGAQARVAAVFKVAQSWVSEVLSMKRRDRAIEDALAALFVPATTTDEAFGPEAITFDKRSIAAQNRRRAVAGAAE